MLSGNIIYAVILKLLKYTHEANRTYLDTYTNPELTKLKKL